MSHREGTAEGDGSSYYNVKIFITMASLRQAQDKKLENVKGNIEVMIAVLCTFCLSHTLAMLIVRVLLHNAIQGRSYFNSTSVFFIKSKYFQYLRRQAVTLA